MRLRGPRRSDDVGAVAVIVAILITVFIGFTALVVDVGYWYNVRRQLQAAADSAALAGCQELKLTGGADQAFGVAIQYAMKNAVAPGDGLQVVPRGETVNGKVASEVGSDYVKVTVRKAAPVFFSGIFGGADGYIVAQARAQLQWIAGMPGVMPLFLPIIGPQQWVRVRIGTSGAWYDLDKGPNDTWSIAGLRVGGASSSTGYPIQVGIAAAKGGDPLFIFDDAARVVVRPSSSPITDVSMNSGWVTGYADGSVKPTQVSVVIGSTEAPTQVSIGNQKVNNPTQIDATHWSATFAAQGTTQEYETWPVGVTFGSGSKKSQLSSIATLVARRTTCPVGNVVVSPTVVGGPDALVSVTVTLGQLVEGEPYQLKIGDGEGTIGSLMAVDLNSLHHPAGEAPDPAGSHGGAGYGTYLATGFPYSIHVGDTVETLPGGKAGPSRQIFDRMSDGVSYATWLANGRSMASSHVVYIPIVEFADATKERRTLTVVGFSAFYLDGDASKGGQPTVVGYFIKAYMGPGTVLDADQPPAFGVQAPRLVSTGLDF